MSERDRLQENGRSPRSASTDDAAGRGTGPLPPMAARQGRFTSRVRETLREFEGRARPSKPAA